MTKGQPLLHWANLDVHALILGGSWLGIGFLYLLKLTKMFRTSPPEIFYEETGNKEVSM